MDAAKIVVEGFLKGAFDVFDAMLSATFQQTAQPVEPLAEAQLEAWLEQFPVLLQCVIENDLGAAALLFSLEDAVRISALIQEEEPAQKAALDEADKEMLKEVAEPALGGGVTNLMERFGRMVEQLERVEVIDTGAAAAGDLLALLGEDAGGAQFHFDSGDGFSGEAVVVFSASLPALAPADLLGAADDGVNVEPALSPEEMSDIMSGFEPQAEEGGAQGALQEVNETNLDLVLDIQLEATARLGRVEMPIMDILGLGPGSVVEVGHLVDDPIELLINGKLIARGDVVVVDEKFGLRITEIINTRERIESLR